MGIDILEIGVDDIALGRQFAMELGVSESVERNEIVGHDTTAAIYSAMLAQGVAFERIGKMYAVGIGQLTMLQTVYHIHGIILGLALGVWFLDATAGRSEIMRHGETNHRAVGQVDGTLHESLAEGTATYNHTAVLVLDGTCDNLRRRCRILIYEHHHLAIQELTVALCLIVISRHLPSLGIYNKVVLLKKLIGNVHGSLEIAASVALKVEDKVAHALFLQLGEGIAELVMGGGSEIADAHISNLGSYHIYGINGFNGNLVACDLEGEGVLNATAHNTQHHLGALGSAETSHNLLLRHLHSGNGSVVDIDDTVAGKDTNLLRRTTRDRLDDEERVLHHIKLHSNAVETARKGFVEGFHLLGCGIGGMGVKFFEHTADGILHQLSFINTIHIHIVDSHFGYLQLAQGIVFIHFHHPLRQGGDGYRHHH